MENSQTNTLASRNLFEKFIQIKTTRGVAEFLGISHQKLTYLLYRLPDGARYSSFSISKKSGGSRTIHAPIEPICRAQRMVAVALEENQKPRKCTMAFIRGRGIVTNAKQHLRRRWVLNFDLEDFFGQIHFGRVRGMFRSTRFGFNDKVATLLAHLCCHHGRLPQGAPTSPVISNTICESLDRELLHLAQRNRCRYTRYCDDITLSSNHRIFPSGIAVLRSGKSPLLGNSILAILDRNGFSVNERKTRIAARFEHQEVTGITVNSKSNVRRNRVRQARAMLHAWQVKGLGAAEQEFKERWSSKDRAPWRSEADFKSVLRGRIEFIGQVRGHRDPIYIKLLRRYAQMNPECNSKVLMEIEESSKDVFLCHASEDKPNVVLPIAKALEEAGISFFLDAKEIGWGDSVTGLINRALVGAKYVIVVISKSSLEKHWPQKEMNAALSAEISEGRTRLLPLLVAEDEMSREKLWRKLALHGDKSYLTWDGDPVSIVDAVKDRLLRDTAP